MATRITSKHVHEQLDCLRQELVNAGFDLDARWDVQEGSATYGRAWRVYVNDYHRRLPFAVANQLSGGSGYLGDTARDAVETVRNARRILRAIVETREETQRAIIEQLAALGVPVASLTRGFMDGGLTFAESIAASVALTK